MGIFTKDPAQERIAAALEPLVALMKLDLASRGVQTETWELQGEILDTDDTSLAAREAEEERKRVNGLAAGRDYSPVDPEGKPWAGIPEDASAGPATASGLVFPSASYAWAGPEGAEEATQHPEGPGRE